MSNINEQDVLNDLNIIRNNLNSVNIKYNLNKINYNYSMNK